MGVQDFIIIGIVAAIVALALGYIIKAKKSGQKCIGCPDSSSCGSACSSCCCGCSKGSFEKQN